MKRTHSIKFILILCCPILLFVWESALAQSPVLQYERTKNDLLSLTADETKIAHVKNIQLKRDAGVFTFTSGIFYALSPVNGKVHGLLFLGDGEFVCTPPTEVERKQLYRFYGTEIFDKKIKSVFFLFYDSTFNELSQEVNFAPGDRDNETKSAIKSSEKFIQNESHSGFNFDIFREFLFDESNDFFYAHITASNNWSYFYKIDPFENEEVNLQHESYEAAGSAGWDVRELVCSFYRERREITFVKNPSVEISSYVMNNTFASDLTFSSQCTVSFKSKKPLRKWISIWLYQELTVDSVVLEGRKIFSTRDDESEIVWIGLDHPFPFDTGMATQIFYHGKLVSEQYSWYFLKSSVGWYPWPVDGRQYTTFDLTFHVPDKLSFVAVGSLLHTDTTEGVFTSRWVVTKPIRNASFMIGNLSEYSITPDSLPPITIYEMNGYINAGEGAHKEIADDVQNCLKFFQHVYGKIDLPHFYVAEIPYMHGEAFPGLIHLSLATFFESREQGDDQIFRAHEVAHQWWGVGVDYKTYHDQWLSEAFAEYSGLWYMQLALHDNKKFFDALGVYKNEILSKRKYLFSNGQESGPIWLGRRTQSTATKGDYNLIVYEKGAWVLHMLRNMVLDLKTMNEDVFMQTMKDFFSSFNGKQATTEDFKRTVEKHFGMDMSWFFNQWVYGTDIPTYKIAYRLEDLQNGKYKVHCTVKQSNVPDNFQALVPFFIDFGDKRFARIRFPIKGPVTEFDFPTMPMKPEKVKFNDLSSVLCQIDSEDWE